MRPATADQVLRRYEVSEGPRHSGRGRRPCPFPLPGRCSAPRSAGGWWRQIDARGEALRDVLAEPAEREGGVLPAAAGQVGADRGPVLTRLRLRGRGGHRPSRRCSGGLSTSPCGTAGAARRRRHRGGSGRNTRIGPRRARPASPGPAPGCGAHAGAAREGMLRAETRRAWPGRRRGGAAPSARGGPARRAPRRRTQRAR